MSTRTRPTGALLACLLLLLGHATPAPAQGKLVVLDREASLITVLNPDTERILARLSTSGHPRGVAVSPDGGLAYVATDGTGPTVSVLDLRTLSVRAVFVPDVVGRLRGIRVSHSGRRLWLSTEGTEVLEMDARTGALLMVWKTGEVRETTSSAGRPLVSSPDGRKLYIANRQAGSVSVIDRLTITARRIPAGTGPTGLDLTPDGRELWVANGRDNTLTVIDTRHDVPVATLPSGGSEPVHVGVRPGGREVWVVHRASRELTVFDLASRRLIAVLPVTEEPRALVFSPDGRQVFVNLPGARAVEVVDAATREVLGVFSTEIGPYWMAWGGVAGPAGAVTAR
ncbi:MAG: beta-propeller fold lactonase family protein [Gemmatimonadota bacterium]